MINADKIYLPTMGENNLQIIYTGNVVCNKYKQLRLNTCLLDGQCREKYTPCLSLSVTWLVSDIFPVIHRFDRFYNDSHSGYIIEEMFKLINHYMIDT